MHVKKELALFSQVFCFASYHAHSLMSTTVRCHLPWDALIGPSVRLEAILFELRNHLIKNQVQLRRRVTP